ncbi:protein lifeguard 1 [Salarias fasciatus]|nr:protein lifeguard 1-like [Salarias fasciatus]
MDQTNDGSSSGGGYGPHPPPYSAQDYAQNSHTAMGHQVGNGGVAVVSTAATYDNMVHPGGHTALDGRQYGEAPPEHALDSDIGVFSDPAIRRGFIRKVYLTLMIQLLVTVGLICAFLYWDTLRNWTIGNYWFSYSLMVAVLVLILALSCCGNLRRRVPINFIALGLFTIVEGLMLGSVTVYFNADAVLWAVGATALVSFALSLFAMQSKWDFTAASGSLWVFGWTLFSFAMLCAILRSQYVYITYACLGTLLFSLYLVFDTQLILGGKHRNFELSPEEYVFAALSLYLDVVSLFLLLLQLIGLCR